jgi:hypothetical protein
MSISTDQNNKRWDYPAHKVKDNPALPEIWRQFIAYHASQDFFDEIAGLFYAAISKWYPERYPTRETLTHYKAGVRKQHDFDDRDILMDAMISGNTPVTTASSVRSSHLDRGNKLFSGLFYMRPETYHAVGGDLTIGKFKQSIAPGDRAWKFDGNYVDDKYLDVFQTIKYDKNLLVLFINTLDSIHGVTVRQPSPHSRLFVNLVGEVSPRLYETESRGVPAHYLMADGTDPSSGTIASVWSKVQRIFR